MKMRDIINLVETVLTSSDVVHNGSRSDLRKLLRQINADPDGGAVRGLLIDGDLYFWNSGLATHQEIRGARRGISIFLNAKNVMVDDDYLRHSAPDGCAQIIRSNPHLQAIYGADFPLKIRRVSDED